jgi:hypothetical protein
VVFGLRVVSGFKVGRVPADFLTCSKMQALAHWRWRGTGAFVTSIMAFIAITAENSALNRCGLLEY